MTAKMTNMKSNKMSLSQLLICLSALILQSPCHSASIWQRARRVVGGRELQPGAWPWLVSLNYKEHHEYLELQGLRHLCGGTLIHPQWVLTAAHCVHHGSGDAGLADASNWEAVVGEYDRRVDEDREQTIQIETIYVSPNYTIFPKLTADIALLKLSRPVTVTNDVRPIGIDSHRKIATGRTCQAAGWGQHTGDEPGEAQYGNGTLVPHVVDVNKVSTNICRIAYKMFIPLVDDKVICFNSNNRGDTCKGDSGGPLLCRDSNGEQRVTGIVSVGMGCAVPGYPGIYTRVASFSQWIEQTIGVDENLDSSWDVVANFERRLAETVIA